jgi:hypothetical protein
VLELLDKVAMVVALRTPLESMVVVVVVVQVR